MMIKNTLAIISIILFACTNQHHDHSANNSTKTETSDEIVIKPTDGTIADTSKKSLPAFATGNVNGRKLVIHYHSPAVRGRVIWGGLVAYDQVWVTGAHNATSFESPSDFIIGNQKIPAGKYAFFTIPGKDDWTVIINKNWDQHLADEYNQSEDAVRITVRPAQSAHQERLMYTIDQTGEYKAVIEMRWEKVQLRVPLELVH